ncbi:MAG: hypothetical protein ACRCZ9_12300 [Fusobacteriaceae bacterium]
MSNSINNFVDLTNIERCVLMDETASITAKSFRVHIPRLLPMVKTASPTEEAVQAKSSSLANSYSGTMSLSIGNCVVAKSMTDYRIYHFGQVFETSGTKHTTEMTVVEEKPAGPGPHDHPHIEHNHEMAKPIEIYDMKYEQLNKITINKGHKMIGVFVSGDINDFRIIHIEDVIPQDGDA